jgi:hypothetical protein
MVFGGWDSKGEWGMNWKRQTTGGQEEHLLLDMDTTEPDLLDK